jgi:ankyrin repeat protein
MTTDREKKSLICDEYAKTHPAEWDAYFPRLTEAKQHDGSYLMGLDADTFSKILMKVLRAYSCSDDLTGYRSLLSCCKGSKDYTAMRKALRKIVVWLRTSTEKEDDLFGTWAKAPEDLEVLHECAKALKVRPEQLLVEVARVLKPGTWGDLLARVALCGDEQCLFGEEGLLHNLPILQRRATTHSSARFALRRAMGHAIVGRHPACLEALLKAYSSVDAELRTNENLPNENLDPGGCVLTVACGAGQLACVRLLINSKVDVNKALNERTARLACGWYAVQFRATLRAGTNALAIACENGRTEVVRELLDNGADRNAENEYRESAATFATRGGHLDCLQLLAGSPPELHGIAPRHLTPQDDPNDVASMGLIGEAVQHSRPECLEYLLQALNDVPKALSLSRDGLGPLHRAALADNSLCVAPLAKLCVGEHACHLERPVSETSPTTRCKGWTPVMCAILNMSDSERGRGKAFYGTGAALRVLLECKADPNKGCYHRGHTPIHMAAELGAEECTRLLLLHGADPGTTVEADSDLRGYTPIMSAAAEGHSECVRLLCQTDKGLATIDSRAENGHTALMLATRPQSRQGRQFTCPAENLECALVLLEFGADPDLYNNTGKTPLMTACMRADLGVILALVDAVPQHKANPNLMTRGNSHMTPLMLLANCTTHAEEKVPCFEALLKAKADPNLRCDDGPTALHLALRPEPLVSISPDAMDTVPLLLRHKADVNALSAHGGTPLHTLCTWSQGEQSTRLLTLLIEAGANVHQVDNEGCTPLLKLAERGHAASIRELIARGADPNQDDGYGYTPLMAAACSAACSVESVCVLLEKGAKATRRDRRHRKTAREQCIGRSGRETIAELLKEHEEAEGDEMAEKRSRKRARKRAKGVRKVQRIVTDGAEF